MPVLSELPLSTCGCKKFTIDVLGDHVTTCTDHSWVKKTHDWTVEQLPDLFHTTHRVKTQEVTRNPGQWCGDIELVTYLTNVTGPVPLVLDLHITHKRFWSRSDPSINGHLHYPHDWDRPLNEVVTDKILQYHTDYRLSSNTISFFFIFRSSVTKLHNLTVVSSTTTVWSSPHISNRKTHSITHIIQIVVSLM